MKYLDNFVVTAFAIMCGFAGMFSIWQDRKTAIALSVTAVMSTMVLGTAGYWVRMTISWGIFVVAFLYATKS